MEWGWGWRVISATLAAAAFCVVSAAPAGAVDHLFWAQYESNAIAQADTDGTDGGLLNATGSGIGLPRGTAIDSTTGRLYFPSSSSDTIGFVRLDGSGGGTLNTAGATISDPFGVSIDTVGRRIYWGNASTSTIGYANLDGSGGGDLNTTGASPGNALGVAVDRPGGRVWWTRSNGSDSGISYANLDGSGGGGDLNTTGAPLANPRGLAVDHPTGRVYWTNGFQGSIGYANLDGSGGGGEVQFDNEFPASGLLGLAIDRPTIDTAHIYFAASNNNAIIGSGLDGSNVDEIVMSGVTPSSPMFPSLLKVPAGAGAPAITGGPNVGSKLSCGRGQWVPDAGESFRFQEPTTYAYAWTRNGDKIAGANANELVADQVGTYRCEVTGTNAAGSAVQVSAPIEIGDAKCPDVSATGKNFRPRRVRFDIPRARGVRARVTVSQPSLTKVSAAISFPEGSRELTVDLGTVTKRVHGSRNMPFPLPPGHHYGLLVGNPVTMNMKIKASPLDNADCTDPGVAHLSFETRIAIVNDPRPGGE